MPAAGLRLLADRTGLTGALLAVLGRRSCTPRHDRGWVLVDVAVMLADGGEAIADIDVVRHQGEVLGPVASAPTVWRTLDELTATRLAKIDKARARVRRHVWSQLPHGAPASKVAGTDLGEVVVLDVDATIVVSQGEKEHAAPTFKGTFGFHPLAVCVATPPNCWPPDCGRATLGPTPPPITSRCTHCDQPDPQNTPQTPVHSGRWRRSLPWAVGLAH